MTSYSDEELLKMSYIFDEDSTSFDAEEHNTEQDSDKILQLANIGLNFLKSKKDKRIIELPIPMYSIVYVYTEERVFDYSSGKTPTCENKALCDETYACNGKECKVIPHIEQKIYTPNSIWFEFIGKNYGKCVFGTLPEAVKLARDKFGDEICNQNGIPKVE